MTGIRRRDTLRGIGVGIAALSVASLAGCAGGTADGGSSGGSDESGGGADTSTSAPDTTASGGDAASSDGGSSDGEASDSEASDSEASDGGSGGVPGEVNAWMDDVGNYDGVVEETGSVTVTVGAEGNGGNFAFDPPAVRVTTGTTVTWQWSGKGGSHDVVAEDGSFKSELNGEEGHTFEHTFEEAGTHTYYCQPHKTLGMKGAVVVE